MIGFLSRDSLADLDSKGNITNKLSRKSHKAENYTFTLSTKLALECSVFKISMEFAF